MNSFSETNLYDLFPSSYGKIDKCMYAYYKTIKKFADKVKNSKILDVGCGLGNYTTLFTSNRNSVYAIEILDVRDKKFSSNYKFILYDGSIFPFKNNTFEVVMNFDVIEHVKNDTKFVKEMYRVLKPGGSTIVATPNRHRIASILLKLIGKKDVFPKVMQEEGIGGKSIHEREYTSGELKKLFSKTGFKDIKTYGCWMGVRGKYNFGTERFVIPAFAHTIFLYASK